MNGTTDPPSAAAESAFQDVRLSLEPASLDLALGKRKVRAIEPDGTLIYETEKTTSDGLTEQLERIWNEYPNGLLDISEDKLDKLPPDEVAVKAQDDGPEKGKARDPSKMMEHQDMEDLRSEVYGSLNEARNQLYYVLELAKTLAASSTFTNQPPPPPAHAPNAGQKKGKPKAPAKPMEGDAKSVLSASVPTEPPLLPPGTLSTTSSSQPSKPTHAQVHELELILAAKQQALDECSALIDSAVSELQMMSTAGDRFWRDVRTLKDGQGSRDQWAVVPKPDFGRTMGETDRAKDIIVPYAVDEASRAQRARCLAAFDLDPTKDDALTFGARSFLRLRVTLKDETGAVIGSAPARIDSAASVREQMETVQLEAFDEDLFGEIRYEASKKAKSEIEPRSVTISAAEYALTFELYDSRSPPTVVVSPLCEVVVSASRLNLLNLLRHRKSQLVGGSQVEVAPSILEPILQALRYRQLSKTVQSTLDNFARTLISANVDAVVIRQMSAGDNKAGGIRDFLLGKTGAESISGSFRLEIAESACVGVRIDTRAPFSTTVVLSDSTFDVSNPDELPHILAEELEAQLIRLAEKVTRDKLPNGPIKSKIFFDELEGMLHLGQLGLLRITIPPPFHSILGHVDPRDVRAAVNVSDQEGVKGFDSRREGDLRTWLEGLAERL